MVCWMELSEPWVRVMRPFWLFVKKLFPWDCAWSSKAQDVTQPVWKKSSVALIFCGHKNVNCPLILFDKHYLCVVLIKFTDFSHFELEKISYIWYSVREHYGKDRTNSMNFKTFLKQTWLRATVYFTVCAAIYSLLMIITNVREEEVLLSAEQLLLIFVFAILSGLAQGILRLPSLSGAVRYPCHYVILALGFYSCFLLPAQMRGSQIFVGLVFFTLVYLAVVGLSALFLARFRSNAEKETPSESQFKKK